MMTIEEIVSAAKEAGHSEDTLLCIAGELDSQFYTRPPFELLLYEALLILMKD